VSIGRELTKAHEEFIRGPLSTVLARLEKPVGELTVVVDIGQTTDISRLEGIPDAEIVMLFGQMTFNDGETKRATIARFAKSHGLAPNRVYRALENASKSGE